MERWAYGARPFRPGVGRGSSISCPQASLTKTTLQFSASSDDAGKYLLPTLPPGTYDVAISLGGFETYRQSGVTVTADAIQSVNAALKAGADSDRQALLDRIETLEKRISDLETSTVLSEQIGRAHV